MSESSAAVRLIGTHIAHPVQAPVEMRLSLPANLTGHVRLETVGIFTAVGLSPAEARELAAALIEFADQADQAE